MPINLNPNTPVSAVTLLQYLTDVQRVLHDSTYAFWSQAELIDYINKARRKIAAETGCTRTLVEAVDLSEGLGVYDFYSLVTDRQALCVLDIYLNNGGTRIPLYFYPYSQFSRLGTMIYKRSGVPCYWSQLGNAAYVSPVPGVSYTADFDVSIVPLNLAATTDIDAEILPPFTELVKFYVGYLAKIKDQRRDQAEDFLNDFYREMRLASASGIVRRLIGR